MAFLDFLAERCTDFFIVNNRLGGGVSGMVIGLAGCYSGDGVIGDLIAM